jgi:signal transduction histidine kinase
MDNPEKLADSLEKISRASGHLLNLVNEVLDISKIDSGKSVIEEDMCSIHEIIDNVCQIMQNEIDSKKLKINFFKGIIFYITSFVTKCYTQSP